MRCTPILIGLLLCTTLVAQNVYDVYPERAASSQSKTDSGNTKQKGDKEKKNVFLGFTGGMMLHIGYAFAKSPDELYRNGSLHSVDLSTDGVTLGLGGALRLHLLNHLHIGAEGGVSVMQTMKSGSNIRSGWGGALCDFYGTVGKAQFLIGGLIGGGSVKRLYVPDNEVQVATDNMTYNASYTQTPYFLLDPYIGMEFEITKHINLLIKVDYALPFGKGTTGIQKETIRWSNFLAPSGPRLYVGMMFGHHRRR